MHRLSDAQRGACMMIVRAPEAWSRWEDLEREWGAEVLGQLVAMELVTAWVRPDYVAITLTPWGAYRCRAHVEEQWRPATETREERDESRPLAGAVAVSERVLVETPVWREGDESLRPVRLPRHARIGCSLVRAELVAAPEPRGGPELLTGEDGEPVRLFPAFGGGVTVRVDRRIRGKR